MASEADMREPERLAANDEDLRALDKFAMAARTRKQETDPWH